MIDPASGEDEAWGGMDWERLRANLRAHERDRVPEPATLPERFSEVEELGRGGVGVVYGAFDQSLGRRVAVKVLLADGGEEATRRLHVEARALAALQHRNVVRVHEILEEPTRTLLVLERVEGVSLAERLRDSAFEPREVARIGREIAEGLAAAHAAGILHRDVKPGNVLLDPDGTPRLGDFGLARPSADTLTGGTGAGAVLGTPGYMSPEQAAGGALDERSDIYGLGATLVSLLTRAVPSSGGERFDASVPPRLAQICRRCLAEDPAQRYPSARAVAEDLESFLVERPAPRSLSGGLLLIVALLVVAGGLVARGLGPSSPEAATPLGTPEVVSASAATPSEVARPDSPIRLAHPSVWNVGFTRQGTRLVSFGDRELREWDLETGRLAQAPRRAGGVAVGERVAVVWGREPYATDTATWSERVDLPRVGAERLTLSSDERLVCANRRDLVSICDLRTGALVCQLPAPKGARINLCTFTPGGERLIVALQLMGGAGVKVQEIQIWSLPRGSLPGGQVLATRRQSKPSAFAVSPDGQTLAVGDVFGAVSLLRLEDLEPQGALGAPIQSEGELYTPRLRIGALAYAGDLLLAASAGNSRRARQAPNALSVWNVGTGQKAGELFPTRRSLYEALAVDLTSGRLALAATEEGQIIVAPLRTLRSD